MGYVLSFFIFLALFLHYATEQIKTGLINHLEHCIESTEWCENRLEEVKKL